MKYLEGRNPVLEGLQAGKQIKHIYFKKGINKDAKIKRILNTATKRKIIVKECSVKFLDNLSQTGKHQGVIAVKSKEKVFSLKQLLSGIDTRGEMPFVVYIRDVFNEYNAGSIIRSAECAGAHAVVFPPKVDITSQMVRASMGASEHIALINENLFQAIKIAREEDIKVVGIEVSGKRNYFEEDLKGPVMMIIGGEDRSLSESVIKKCDVIVKIPLLGKINSLNMSIAASLVMCEKVRQEL